VNRHARAVAIVAASSFQRLTGKPPTVRVSSATPTAYGPFITLLDSVFDALSIDASAVTMARIAIAHRAGMIRTGNV
jgi:hypothetical protein